MKLQISFTSALVSFTSALATLTALTLLAGAAVASDPVQSTSQANPRPTKPAKNGKTNPVPKPSKKTIQPAHSVSPGAAHQNGQAGQAHSSDKTSRPAPHDSHANHADPAHGTPNRAELTVLREELHALRTEEAAVIRNIRLSYDPLINAGHLSVAQLNQLRREIADQKYLAGNSADMDAIRSQYNFLDQVARGDVKRDNTLIRRLKGEENTLIHRVQKLYGAKIANLDKELRPSERGSQHAAR